MITVTDDISRLDKMIQALGGECARHPDDSILERPEDTSARPNLAPYSQAVGDMGEQYVENNCDIEIIDDEHIDGIVTDGPFEGLNVQVKTCSRVVSKNPNYVDGGIYLKGKNMKRLVGGKYKNGKDGEVLLPDELEPAILYTLVYQGREQFRPEVKSELADPVEEIIDSNGDVVCEAAIIGEMAMPAHRVVNGTRFHTGKRNAYDWFWRDAYDSERNDQKLSDIYYRDTFIEEELQ